MSEAGNQDITLKTVSVDIERKKFTIVLKENKRGRFVRIIEESAGRLNSVVVPESGLSEFLDALLFVRV